MFLNSPVKVFSAISNSSLTSVGDELYANGIKLATQADTDTLQTEIDELGVSVNTNTNSINSLGVIVNSQGATINSLGVAINTNTATINSLGVAVNTNTANISTLQSSSLVTDTPLVTPSAGSIIFSDGINPVGTNTDPSFTYQISDDQNFLTVGSAQVISSNNNMKLESPDYILTTKDFYLQGTEDVQRYLTVGRVGLNNNVKTSVDVTTSDYICDNQLASRTQWKGASEYTFDSDVKIGAMGQSKKLYVNDIEIKPPVQFLNNYYVSGSGTDSDGDGSIYNPWGTVAHAIFVLSAIAGDIQATINISAGTYNENLTINKSGIALIGASSNLPNLTTINGNITFDMTNNTSFFSVGGLENIQLNGTLEHRQTNLYTNSLNVINCLFFAQATKSAIITFGTGGGLLGNLTIQASLIYMSDAVAVAIDNTAISMINTQLTNSPLLAVSPTSFITVVGAGRINLFGCSIFQGSTVSTVDPLVLVDNTSTVTSSSTINSCILVYTSSTSDAGTLNKACVKFSGTASMNTYTLVYNYFRCVGAQTGSPNNQCVQRTGTAQLAIIFGSNVAASQAHHVAPAAGSYTKTLLTAVV
jgi:hypothetical protein